MENINFSCGHYRRFPEIFEDGEPLILAPIDDALIFGPNNGLEELNKKIEELVEADVDGILCFPGSLRRNFMRFRDMRCIINLTGSTFRSFHTYKRKVFSIETALKFAASAVAFHINISSKFEGEMLEVAGQIIEEAQRYEIPVFAIVYPRKEGFNNETDDNYLDLREKDNDSYVDMVSHCVSLASDLGVHAIKTQFTGTVSGFKNVIRSAHGVPIFIAGGSLVEDAEIIKVAAKAVEAGARGVSFGRNIYGRDDVKTFIEKLRLQINTAWRLSKPQA